MKTNMTMPKMGESITEGTINKWLKSPGDALEADEIILEISTDKVDSEIPTPVAGKLIEILANEGETLAVGAVIAVIESETDATEEETTAEETSGAPEIETPTIIPKQTSSTPVKSDRFYSPVVMNIAHKNNIPFSELETISGSGINGRVSKKDVLNYLNNRSNTISLTPEAVKESATAKAGYSEKIPMNNMRKKIAAHMIGSKQTSAHVHLYTEVDMRQITTLRASMKSEFKAKEGFNLTFTPFIVEAAVTALKEFPLLNAKIEGEHIIKQHFYNIGIAVAVENGLMVPNIFNCEEKNLTGLARAVNDVANRARHKKLNPDELLNGTFSISNFGVYGTTIGFPIINQPQVAILGVGAIQKRPVVINDAIAIRPIMNLALTIDHRLIDGAMGSQFLERIRALLEQRQPQ
jgi:2-oxoglutarate dehydrogenase E2 component (dihydrolipoamide succinyltransferase)